MSSRIYISAGLGYKCERVARGARVLCLKNLPVNSGNTNSPGCVEQRKEMGGGVFMSNGGGSMDAEEFQAYPLTRAIYGFSFYILSFARKTFFPRNSYGVYYSRVVWKKKENLSQ